ncbi:aminotransferase class I/II-fold pyridoxal phosphate-dependent enzyme [Amycolatopsis anabasis]|uniref:aminotransferase class I/II-fold pyridoxal phosphate-dependent enzyme n=1 Tax=Amycolatopsis anabasis TaxID=1840409 RepID=UPI00131CCD60|nr:aminotransferase class I/II-fold pyridoxal phosphate-dependent enzyme [Amycolatopsis anabasis]
MSGNESHAGPLPAAMRAMMHAASGAHRYPDTASTRLVEALATHLRVAPEMVAVGAGSSALLQRLVDIACGENGHTVVTPSPAFGAYGLFAANAGAPHRQIPLTPDGTVDLDAIGAALDPPTRIVLLSNPHNPTGTVLDNGQLRRFLDTVPDRVLVVLDEAYVEYATPGVVDGVMLAKAQWTAGRDNVAVVRTFSKAYGLAGLRVGYLVAPPMLAAAVAAAALSFEVSSIGQAAALASLAAQGTLHARCELLAGERARVLAALREQGFVPPDSQANHIWLPVGEDAARFAEHSLGFGLTIMVYPEQGVRVTLGSRADNDLFLAAARAWTSGTRD